MTDRKIRSLGLEVTQQVPSTNEEYDTAAKKVNAACVAAVDQIVAHIWLTEFRDMFLHGREASAATDSAAAVEAIQGIDGITGIPRKVKPVLTKEGAQKKDANGNEVTTPDESEGEYFNRVIDQLVSDKKFPHAEAAKESFATLAQNIADQIPFDVEAAERVARGPKGLAVEYKISAAYVITRGTVDKLNTILQTEIGKTFVASNDTTKMYTGTFPQKDPSTGVVTDVPFNVSEKDALALGTLLKERATWKAAQDKTELAARLGE